MYVRAGLASAHGFQICPEIKAVQRHIFVIHVFWNKQTVWILTNNISKFILMNVFEFDE